MTIGMQLFAVTDLRTVWIEVQVRATDAAHLRDGTNAHIDVTGLTGRSSVGRVSYVSATRK